MTRFYDPPIRFWYRMPSGRDHTITIVAWNLASDTFLIEDTCCNIRTEMPQRVLAQGTAAPWHAASIREADEWLEARVSLGLANTYTF